MHVDRVCEDAPLEGKRWEPQSLTGLPLFTVPLHAAVPDNCFSTHYRPEGAEGSPPLNLSLGPRFVDSESACSATWIDTPARPTGSTSSMSSRIEMLMWRSYIGRLSLAQAIAFSISWKQQLSPSSMMK